MKTNKIRDYNSPLFIDIGADTVKYSQPILNTCKLTKEIINNKEKGGKLDSNEIVNANTVFDYKNSMICKNTIDYLFNMTKGGNANAILDYNSFRNTELVFDYSGVGESINTTFGYEPIYEGLINLYNFDRWEQIVTQIGQEKYSKQYFENEYFGETPLIISLETLPIEDLEFQVKRIYEMCFERLNAQYVLICSQAMINLISHNLSSGIVVDIGESKTSIIPVINGFACYDKGIKNNFLCGRTITTMLAQINKIQQDDHFGYNPPISVEEYIKAKALKESDDFSCHVRNSPGNSKYNHLSYLLSFPEVFRSLYRVNNRTTHDSIRAFIKKDSLLYFNDRDSLKIFNQIPGKGVQEKVMTSKEWELSLTKNYTSSQLLNNAADYQLMQNESNCISKEQLIYFRHCSLTQLLCSQIEKYISEDIENSSKYSNIVFSGGVLNTKNLPRILEKDFKSLMHNAEKTTHLYFPKPEDNASCGFYKGANYISKLDNLDSLMISRQEYFDVGKENLCYNYI